MKQAKMIVIVTAMAFTILIVLIDARSSAANKQGPIKGNGFAVLELFTSEGCSSCPPADALVAHIQQEAGDKPVYILAYHVDYWNHLGWKDVFSDQAFSKRQYQYSHQLGAEVYTPQLVVNGQRECVGSDETTVRHYLGNALDGAATAATAATPTVHIQVKLQAGKATLSYTIDGKVGKDHLVIAVIEKQAVSQVKRGENAGRTLTHVQIVRKLIEDKASATGSQKIDLPDGFNTPGWEIIALLQDPDSGSIDAAAKAGLAQ